MDVETMAASAPGQPQINPWMVAVALDEAAWALTACLVANAIVLPITGKFQGRGAAALH